MKVKRLEVVTLGGDMDNMFPGKDVLSLQKWGDYGGPVHKGLYSIVKYDPIVFLLGPMSATVHQHNVKYKNYSYDGSNC